MTFYRRKTHQDPSRSEQFEQLYDQYDKHMTRMVVLNSLYSEEDARASALLKQSDRLEPNWNI